MKNKRLVWLITIWIAIKILNYYFFTFILLPFTLFVMFILFFIMTIIQTVKIINERKQLSKSRLRKLTVYSILLIFSSLYPYTNRLIEKSDWHLNYNKRMEIVEQVRSFKLNPNDENNDIWCKLPYTIPVVSNDGNKIRIERENSLYPKISIEFIIYSGFIDQPSTMLIYSDDLVKLALLENAIAANPEENWKIEKNWYRIRSDF